jgi:adenine deaminase
MELKKLISVAKGETPADLILSNARIVNTFIGQIDRGNIAIYGDRIAGVGDYKQGKQVIDLEGEYLAPGLIDGHTHIESSMLHPSIYANTLIPRGISTVITDLHEIANICGLDGIRFVLDSIKGMPLDILLMIPSCVPATSLETTGACIAMAEIEELLHDSRVIGLGEMMNFPGVINGSDDVLNKLYRFKGEVIDGHAPGLTGKDLNAYIASGILSDHESTSAREGQEKLEKGMYLMIREGSSEKNLDALLPLVTEKTFKRCIFVVDDRSCLDLYREGDVDAVLRKAIGKGLEPIRAIQMATINPAEHFRLYDRGAIAPGYLANLITMRDLHRLEIDMVFYNGAMVVRNGKNLFSQSAIKFGLEDTIHIKPISPESLNLPGMGETYPVIEIVSGQIITRKKMAKVKIQKGFIVPDIQRDILKLVVVERHHASGNIGLGLVKGFGLKKGALASSMAHDSHNIIVASTNDTDILTAVKEIERLHGGLVVCADGQVLASLPLPVAGLLSTEPIEVVIQQFKKLETAATSIGSLPPAPFSILSFLALPVIPELRLTDLGLVDVTAFKFINQQSG